MVVSKMYLRCMRQLSPSRPSVKAKEIKMPGEVEQEEKVLKSLFLISTGFKDLQEGKSCRLRRSINVVILIYLMLEMLKLVAWVLLPEKHPFSIFTGSYFLVLGVAGKLLYIAIASVTLNAFICRLGMLMKEPKKELTFLLEPMA